MSKLNLKSHKHFLISAVIAGFLVILVNTAIWANRFIFDTNTFTSTAVTSITSQSSRDAIAGEITDTVLADYPKVKSVVGDKADSFISGLLDSNLVEKALNKTVSRLQIFLTSEQRQPVVIDLSSTKEAIAKLIQFTGREDEARIDPEKIPNEVVLFNPDNYPNFYKQSVAFMLISPILILVVAGLLAWPYVKSPKQYKFYMVTQGAILLVSTFFAFALGPLFKPIAIGQIQSANMRVVVGNLYDSFLSGFNKQLLVVLVCSLVLISVPLTMNIVNKYKSK